MAAVLAPPPPIQPLAFVTRDVRAHVRPDPRSRAPERVGARTPITGARTTLPVIGKRRGSDGRIWLHVALPGRPNGHRGWIPRTSANTGSTPWALRITLSSRILAVYRRGRLVRRFPAIVGQPLTPTPRGRFFVEDNVRLGPGVPGAPYALALSARSDVLQEFAGGPGQIAVHGRANIGGTLRTAVSHGCIRLDDADIAWLARRVVPGVPVSIG
jgi:lipoprotein-anchoring transpeptidase ErfK/SrfK